ncbi:hypothetical protein Tco_1317173 [Tanacetum coccineum]
MEGYKLKDLKFKEFDSIQDMFDRAFKRVNTFEDFRTELVEGKEKRAGTELIQENAKKQKVEDDKETAVLKQCLEIIPYEEEVTSDVTLAAKSQVFTFLEDATYADLYVGRKEVSLDTYTFKDAWQKKGFIIDYESEMAYQLLKFTSSKQIKK